MKFLQRKLQFGIEGEGKGVPEEAVETACVFDKGVVEEAFESADEVMGEVMGKVEKVCMVAVAMLRQDAGEGEGTSKGAVKDKRMIDDTGTGTNESETEGAVEGEDESGRAV
ncbi:hypothetical protein NSMS1_68000 (plasmid) [Nostoc sp. MS1]|nr:hypothetical protein NSMS1_68000 [Nostoc sp. MS1]